MQRRNRYPLRYQPVFTPVGGAVLVVAVLGLIRALLNRNAYEIVLSCAALLILLVMGIIGKWKTEKLKTMEPGWKTPFPMTACLPSDNGQINTEDDTIITGLSSAVPLFFRLHFKIRGRFLPCGAGFKTGLIMNRKKEQGCPVSAETSIKRGDTSAKILLDFPMSGIFHGDGFCRLRDIFGFFSFYCGQPQHSAVNIRCAPCYGKQTQINAQSGAEDQRNKPSSDIERYYMREYTPGDRFRDINWKSSEKIDTLITRISTDNQEKISRLEVHFRNYTSVSTILNISKTDVQESAGEFSLESLWLLDRAKARLSYFLRSLMEQNSHLVFDVRSPSGNWEIENMDDLDAFFEELAGLSFMPLQQEAFAQAAGKSDIYVFSTACDFGLNGFLVSNSQRPITLFLVQPAEKNKGLETEFLRMSDFNLNGISYDLRQTRKNKIKPLMVNANKTEMFYAGLKYE
jgi:hypothetical protein